MVRKLEEKRIFVVLPNDLPKVFDCVSHEFLLVKLDEYGFDQKSVTFFSTCLKNRRERTKVVSQFNDLVRIAYGIFQFERNIEYRNSKKSIFKFKLKLNIKKVISNLNFKKF